MPKKSPAKENEQKEVIEWNKASKEGEVEETIVDNTRYNNLKSTQKMIMVKILQILKKKALNQILLVIQM
ncbi:hypothetical protein I6H46_02460 [Anaerococcus obesiensis]|uniref:Endo-alpha-N-acetylgalactosaminidase N-terminal domain-containing protein n=1 Tax=Anaerococcus obesiensis TaxID=1287640 RepID=A0A7T7UUJ6_9FIRM|nr:hypothetical protein [Anaerococcus obesiensis]QQN56492.1 hypothetical protein I6H46_02460 [Anaerococcus obesiensis]